MSWSIRLLGALFLLASTSCQLSPLGDGYAYIVVGSGAGGGPLASRLAREGHRVLLLEAGQDVGGKLHYKVPAMHALSTEDPDMAWWYFVEHSADPAVDLSDSKYTPEGSSTLAGVRWGVPLR